MAQRFDMSSEIRELWKTKLALWEFNGHINVLDMRLWTSKRTTRRLCRDGARELLETAAARYLADHAEPEDWERIEAGAKSYGEAAFDYFREPATKPKRKKAGKRSFRELKRDKEQESPGHDIWRSTHDLEVKMQERLALIDKSCDKARDVLWALVEALEFCETEPTTGYFEAVADFQERHELSSREQRDVERLWKRAYDAHQNYLHERARSSVAEWPAVAGDGRREPPTWQAVAARMDSIVRSEGPQWWSPPLGLEWEDAVGRLRVWHLLQLDEFNDVFERLTLDLTEGVLADIGGVDLPSHQLWQLSKVLDFNTEARTAIQACIPFVASSQEADGCWTRRTLDDYLDLPDAGPTAMLCLVLCKIRADKGAAEAAQRAAWWLARHVEEEGFWYDYPELSRLNPESRRLVERERKPCVYTTALAALALTESGIDANEEQLGKVRNWLENGQHPMGYWAEEGCTWPALTVTVLEALEAIEKYLAPPGFEVPVELADETTYIVYANTHRKRHLIGAADYEKYRERAEAGEFDLCVDAAACEAWVKRGKKLCHIPLKNAEARALEVCMCARRSASFPLLRGDEPYSGMPLRKQFTDARKMVDPEYEWFLTDASVHYEPRYRFAPPSGKTWCLLTQYSPQVGKGHSSASA